MPAFNHTRTLTAEDEKRLSRALTRRIGPSIMPHTYHPLPEPYLFKVSDPETGSSITAQILPRRRVRVVYFRAPHL